ncbi:hypothetical protein MAM1_0106c05449 [Mucor ambiguus]|uniref:Uncharacterized protein n=1 Tax=Mucor ambiguus TaxID=91626 RepID=A0A0C9MV19_9FUNG|nr:hypothetical protein MAM1_0106c05449 [Mucor ambiguus]
MNQRTGVNNISASPSLPQQVQDVKHAQVDLIMYNFSSSANTSRIPTPTVYILSLVSETIQSRGYFQSI